MKGISLSALILIDALLSGNGQILRDHMGGLIPPNYLSRHLYRFFYVVQMIQEWQTA